MGDAIYESLDEKIQCLMYEKKFSEIRDILEDHERQSLIANQAMNLVSVICSIVKENNEFLKDPDHNQSCSEIVMSLVEKGSPKEVLIGLLESADSFKEDDFFLFLLNPLKKVFTKVPGKRGRTLEWILNVLNAHLLSLPRPENPNLKGKELLLMDLDPIVQRTSDVLAGYLNFLQAFVHEVSFDVVTKTKVHYVDRVYSQRSILQKYLLMILEYPLVYHDLHFKPNQPLSSIQSSCVKIIEYLQKICKNFFDLYKLVMEGGDSKLSCIGEDDEKRISITAIGTLSYLIFVENMAPCNRPYVYRHTHLFEMHISVISHLLSQNENLVVYKGLHLCSCLMNRVPDCELPSQDMKVEHTITLSKSFFNIAVYSTVKSHRSLAVTLFTKYIKKFRWKERYTLLMHMMTGIPHAGVQGLLVNIYKDFMYSELTGEREEKHFTGKNLLSFMRLAVRLKEGAETDILENYDLILSCLNFIRFLALFDEQNNSSTGFWVVADSLMKDYLEPLHQGIELTRAHYKLAMKNTDDNKKREPEAAAASVVINGTPLPDLPPNYKAVIYEKAILSLDMVESILSRVKELLEKPK